MRLSALGFGLSASLMLTAESREPRAAVPHLMPDGQGSARLVEKRAYIMITVPVASLHGVDDDRDGLLSVPEFASHGDSIKAQLLRIVRFTNGDTPGRTLWHELVVPHADSSAGVQTTGITAIRIDEWDSTLTKLTLHADIFSRRAPPEGRQLVFRAIRGDSTEVAILEASRTAAGFFGAQVEATPGDAWKGVAGLVFIVGLFVAYFVQRRANPRSSRARRRATLPASPQN